MWILVMFDLPTETKKERKAAAKFRKNIMADGFTMLQIPFDMRSVIPAICGHSFFKYFYGCKVNVLNRYLGRQTVFFC